MDFDSILNEINELIEEFSQLKLELNSKTASLFDNFLVKVTSSSDAADKVLVNMESEYNDTKLNSTNTESGSIFIKDQVNDRQIPFEESKINEVQ